MSDDRAVVTRGGGHNIAYDVERVRADFPILDQEIRGKPLVYLDNGASAQKPAQVIDAIAHYYRRDHANVHRGVHTLSERATEHYEGARDRARRFLGAASEREIVFVRGTTEGINLVAQSYARPRVGPGDEIVVSELEHHSNIVPWQLVRDATGCTIRKWPITDSGELELDGLERLLSERTRLVAVAHVSNSLGTINPIPEIASRVHDAGAVLMVDGAQGAPHLAIDVSALGCDFYAFSGHKVYGPTGIGVLWAREALLDEMPPYQGGGEMIRSVSFEHTEFHELPHKFEAGTPNIAGAVGLAAALDYVDGVGIERIDAHEQGLLEHATALARAEGSLRLFGTAPHKAGILSMELDGIHAHDVGTILDDEGIAVRAGHHCAMPVMQRYGVAATVRASLGMYNTVEEIDRLFAGLARVREMFRR